MDSEPEPVSINVDLVFDLLKRALCEAVDSHGNKAKAFAWDVNGYFLKEIGHLRAGQDAPYIKAKREGTDHG